ncbi:MFS transporter [Nocardia pseudobrasiliensis]|uniref:DHA1 family inner membrane transport protein n=1 Tax=Nocardia pseudobrasiliensis TaxID=45979 RepID=A0A370IBY2_9NOCA|nr:MFS transporter [Nocardia pseudobrasiliensis]RDI68236.1 DHA1 family inner membrane transport protein [Nocardia pseudobrasiliensis]
MRFSIASLSLCVFGITTGEFVIAGILPDLASDLGVSIPAAGLLVTAYAIGMIVGGPTLTALTTRYPRKPLMVVLLGVAVLGNLASALAPTYAVLFAARLITASITSTFFANAVVTAISTAPEGKQASTVSKLVFGMNVAMIVGAPLGTFVGSHYGWRATFATIAAVGTLGLLLVLWLVPAVASAGGSVVSELRVFRSRDLQLAIVVYAVANAGILMVFTYFAPLLTDVSGFSSGSIAIWLLVYGVGATVGNLTGGRLWDRAKMPSQIGLLTLLALALALMWVTSDITVIIGVLVFIIGALGFAVIPGMQARVLGTASAAPTLALAVNASAYQVAAAFAGWMGGRVIVTSGLRSMYLVAAVITAAGIALSCLAWYRDRIAAEAERTSAPVAEPGMAGQP